MTIARKRRYAEALTETRALIRGAVARAAFILQTETKMQLRKGASPPASEPGSPPHMASGQLAQNIQVDLRFLDDPSPKARVGPDVLIVPYARIQELGGTITPKKGRALAVPIGQEGRKAARNVGAGGLRTLDLVLIKRKGKPPILARVTARSVRPLFVLVPSVTLPARPYLRPSLKLAKPKMLEQFSDIKNKILGRFGE